MGRAMTPVFHHSTAPPLRRPLEAAGWAEEGAAGRRGLFQLLDADVPPHDFFADGLGLFADAVNLEGDDAFLGHVVGEISGYMVGRAGRGMCGPYRAV